MTNHPPGLLLVLNLEVSVRWNWDMSDSFFPLLSVLRSEIRDLRLVLQSSDKELDAVKNELRDSQSKQQREMSQISNNLISTQLQLDKVQYA